MGKYDYVSNFSQELPLGKIAANVKDGSEVLEFGCYTGDLAKYLKEQKNCRVCAVELDEEAFAVAQNHLEDGMNADIENYEWVEYFADKKFDVLICADILEHLRNPGDAIKNALGLLKEDGYILFSIPNIAHNDLVTKLFLNRFDYTETGLLDSTHIHFWGVNNLSDFFAQNGYFLTELDAHMVSTGATEQMWKELKESEETIKLREYIENRAYGEVYQFVGKAYKTEYAVRENLQFQSVISEKASEGKKVDLYYVADITEQQQKVIQLQQGLAEGMRKVEEIQQQKVEIMKQMDEQKKQWKAEVVAMDKEKEALEGKMKKVSGEKNTEEKKRKQLETKLAVEKELHQMTQKALESTEKEKNKLVDDYRNLERAYFAILAERDQMLSSKSWKYTYGLRVVWSKGKQIKGLKLLSKTMKSLKQDGVKYTVKKVKGYLGEKQQENKVAALTLQESEEISFASMLTELKALSETISVSVYHEDKLQSYDADNPENNVLLVSHTLDLTGGPVAVRYFAKKLLEDGYNPIVISPNGGGLVDTLVEDGIPVVVFEQFMHSGFIMKYTPLFSFAVLNTIVCAPLISRLSDCTLPVVWWIHEAKVSYHEGQLAIMPATVGKNIKIYCGGEYARKMLLWHFPNYEAQTLLYYVPDYLGESEELEQYDIGNTEGKIVFASIGMQEQRKGQDILVNAILALPENYLKQSYFLFVGRKFYEPIGDKIDYLCEKYPENVKYIPEIAPTLLKSVYRQMDCLVCTSRDDPMPIVVTEAFLMKKAVICSENAGSAQFIEDGVNGYVYYKDDYTELLEKIKNVIKAKNELQKLGDKAREIYISNFGYEAFHKAIDKVIDDINGESYNEFDVSVVIPTYNGGSQFKDLLKRLKQQKNCGTIEIVIVDSGSKDDTVEVCQEEGVTLVQIPNEKFSHSYARNLGAETAKGKIIAFMTQDAMPSSEDWLYQMIQPIRSGEVAAVSCGEQCPEGTDLYYRVASFGHACYVGFFHGDVVGSIENCKNDEQLRKNASLNDVACVIERKVFLRFKHRFNYAEDLDLGIRLLKKGYKVKLLSKVHVIHAHNRLAGYYLKRALVESEAFCKIFPDHKTIEDENVVVSRIVYSYCVMSEILSAIEANNKKLYSSVAAYIKDVSKMFGDVISRASSVPEYKANESFPCAELERVVEFCVQNYKIYSHASNLNPVHGVKSYLDNSILNYVNQFENKYSEEIREEISQCLMKQFAFFIGAELTKLEKGSKLGMLVEELTKGV